MTIKVKNIVKKFGDFTALDNVDPKVNDGELFALLGPSGSGKTTLLRIIAGLDWPDSVEASFDGENALARGPLSGGKNPVPGRGEIENDRSDAKSFSVSAHGCVSEALSARGGGAAVKSARYNWIDRYPYVAVSNVQLIPVTKL